MTNYINVSMHSKVYPFFFSLFSFLCIFSLFAYLSFSLHPSIFSTPFFPCHYFLHKHCIQTWKWQKTQKENNYLYAQKTIKPTLLVGPKHKDCIETWKNEEKTKNQKQDNEREEEENQEKRRRTMRKKRKLTKRGSGENEKEKKNQMKK